MMATKLFASVLNGFFKFFFCFLNNYKKLCNQLFRPINAHLIFMMLPWLHEKKGATSVSAHQAFTGYLTETHINNSCIISDFLLLTDLSRVLHILKRKIFSVSSLNVLRLPRHYYGWLAFIVAKVNANGNCSCPVSGLGVLSPSSFETSGVKPCQTRKTCTHTVNRKQLNTFLFQTSPLVLILRSWLSLYVLK